MGTNTFHMLVADPQDNKYNVVYKERVAVQLGKGGINDSLITEDAIERAIETLKNFKAIADEYECTHFAATATSAVRNASNQKAFVDRVLNETGIDVRVISGEREAELIHSGVKQALSIGSQPSLVMDIGGGSVEFIICTENEISWKASFEVGGLRLMDMFHKNDPITGHETDALKNYLGEELTTLQEQINLHQPSVLIGSSGTFDTLSEIYHKEQGLQFSLEDQTEYLLPLEAFYMVKDEVVTKNRSERLQIPGMIEMRVDMIVVACLLIDHVLEIAPIKSIRVSAYALKEGLLRTVLSGSAI